MEVIRAIKERRSVRRFTTQEVSDAVLQQLVEAASYAPSAHNGQPWEFCITRDPAKKKALAADRKYAAFLPEAGAVIAVCARLRRPRRVDFDNALPYFEFQDTAAAVQNLLLAACGLGLGTCWVGDFDENKVQEVFKIPADYTPVAVIAVGYPALLPTMPARRPVSEIMHLECF
jgi:nitroreductase